MMSEKDWKELEEQIIGTILLRNKDVKSEEASEKTKQILGKIRTNPKTKKSLDDVQLAMKKIESEIISKSADLKSRLKIQ